MKTEQVTEWIGLPAVDKEGKQLGRINKILTDDQTQKPEWAVVASGWLAKEKPVPLAGARLEDDRVVTNISKDQVASAPDVEQTNSLTSDEEVALFEHYGIPYSGETVTAESGGPISGRSQTTERMPLHEEQLTAKKQTVQTGEARIGKEVVTEQRQIEVPVTHEEAYIERRPVEKRPAESEIGEGEVRVPLMAERASADKRTVVTEEVKVGKRPVQETEQISETVRREEPRLEAGPDTVKDPTEG